MPIVTTASQEGRDLAELARTSADPHISAVIHPISRLRGTVRAPGSKSYTHRAIIVASMGENTLVENPLFCKDTDKTIRTWTQLGATITPDGKNLRIKGFEGHPRPTSGKFDVGESGTLLRLVLPMLALGKGEFEVDGHGSLKDRRNFEIVHALKSCGVEITGRTADYRIPVRLRANGKLRGGNITIGGRTSSQVVSAFLLAAPAAEQDTIITIEGTLVSRPYVDITIDVLKQAGVSVCREGYRKFHVKPGKVSPPRRFEVPGDYSSAAFLIVAAVLTSSEVTITGLVEDKQGDRRIVDYLRQMGANIDVHADALHIKGPQKLHGIEIDCSDTPDLCPILTTVGCFASGKTRIYNVKHLVHKESNRIVEPAAQLRKLGANIEYDIDEGEIISRCSVDQMHGGIVDAANDHRVAMSLAIAGLTMKKKVGITGFQAVDKSYPEFVRHINELGGNITLE